MLAVYSAVGVRRTTPVGIHRTPRRRVRALAWVLAAVAVGTFAAPADGCAQEFASGQNIAPAYEGWETNPDGSYNLVFGYMNRTGRKRSTFRLVPTT